MDDIKNDLDTKRDALLMKNIEKFKQTLASSDDGDGVHGRKASEKVLNEVFLKYSTSRFFRYKSA